MKEDNEKASIMFFPEELKRQFKILCAKKDITMRQGMMNLMEKAILEDKNNEN